MAVIEYLSAFKSLCKREQNTLLESFDGKTNKRPEIASVCVNAAMIFAVDLLERMFKIVQGFLLNIQ